MSLTKLSLAGNNLIIPDRESLVKLLTLFYSKEGATGTKKIAYLLKHQVYLQKAILTMFLAVLRYYHKHAMRKLCIYVYFSMTNLNVVFFLRFQSWYTHIRRTEKRPYFTKYISGPVV